MQAKRGNVIATMTYAGIEFPLIRIDTTWIAIPIENSELRVSWVNRKGGHCYRYGELRVYEWIDNTHAIVYKDMRVEKFTSSDFAKYVYEVYEKFRSHGGGNRPLVTVGRIPAEMRGNLLQVTN